MRKVQDRGEDMKNRLNNWLSVIAAILFIVSILLFVLNNVADAIFYLVVAIFCLVVLILVNQRGARDDLR